MSVYSIAKQIEYDGNQVAVLTPNHISLGKCVTCHSFIRKYASINDIEIRNMLRDGCQFKGFKKIKVESPEEEGFANMHFVLMLSNDDVSKEVCVRRDGRLNLKINNATETVCEAVTDSTSCVVIVSNNSNRNIEFYHFRRNVIRKFTMREDNSADLKFVLMSDILYIERDSNLYFINFGVQEPFQRLIKVSSDQEILLCSSNLVILLQSGFDEQQTLICDTLQRDPIHKLLIPPEDVMEEFIESKLTVLRIRNKFVWLVCSTKKVSLYVTPLSLDGELSLVASIPLVDLFPQSSNFFFNTASYCSSNNHVFLMYTRQVERKTCSTILMIDLHSHRVTSLLELQLTCNRKPHVVMHASRSGHKLFVQETFDNKVIFFQVFRLLPGDLKLQNIVKQFVLESMSEEAIGNQYLPKHLLEQLDDGF